MADSADYVSNIPCAPPRFPTSCFRGHLLTTLDSIRMPKRLLVRYDHPVPQFSFEIIPRSIQVPRYQGIAWAAKHIALEGKTWLTTPLLHRAQEEENLPQVFLPWHRPRSVRLPHTYINIHTLSQKNSKGIIYANPIFFAQTPRPLLRPTP